MIYVTSDLHGYPLNAFQKLLAKANFSEDDFCFVLGDVIDRGPEGIDILKWLMIQPNIQLILGNHEAMMLSCKFLFDTITGESINNLSKEDMEIFTNWIENGADPTLKQLSENDPETVMALLEFLGESPFYETVEIGNKHFLLTHSGLNNFKSDRHVDNYSIEELIWNRPSLSDKYHDDIMTVFGHTPTHFFGEEYRGRAVKTDTWIDIDTGAAYGGSPMLLRLDDMVEFY